MAPTTTAVPLLIRASFLFSGLFGIRLEGLKDQNGQSITVQSAMPLNFTVPAVLMNQTVETFQQHNIQIPDSTTGSSCSNGKCKQSQSNNNNYIISPQISIKFSNINDSAGNSNPSVPPPPPPPTLLPFTDPDQLLLRASTLLPTTTRKIWLGKPCGPGRCSYDEICISWMKMGAGHQHKHGRRGSRRESPMMVHECVPNDGDQWTKIQPSGAKLCERGKTPSIIPQESERNCEGHLDKDKHDDSCEIVWKYDCVNEKDSPHSCSLRECPFTGACIETKHCDLKRLCYVQATCTPEFLLPDKIRHSLRKNTKNQKGNN